MDWRSPPREGGRRGGQAGGVGANSARSRTSEHSRAWPRGPGSSRSPLRADAPGAWIRGGGDDTHAADVAGEAVTASSLVTSVRNLKAELPGLSAEVCGCCLPGTLALAFTGVSRCCAGAACARSVHSGRCEQGGRRRQRAGSILARAAREACAPVSAAAGQSHARPVVWVCGHSGGACCGRPQVPRVHRL